jgi:ribose/xylose/arabinose/galactoside ABC-type transport system permease subunit
MRSSRIDAVAATAVVVVLALAPALIGSRYLTGVLTVAAIYGIWAVSWDFMSGLTGRENFGHSLFIGVGAYAAGILNTQWGLGPWWSLPVGMIASVIFALLMGFPTLRLKGPYFALAMLSGAVIMQRLMLIFWEYTGGEEGINGIEPLLRSPLHYYWMVLAVLVATTAVLGVLARSNWGLILRAIRGDEATCLAAGLNVTFYKIASLVISAAVAGWRPVRALPAAGESPAFCSGDLHHDHHDGLRGRHDLDLRAGGRSVVADPDDRTVARLWRVAADDLQPGADRDSLFHAPGSGGACLGSVASKPSARRGS